MKKRLVIFTIVAVLLNISYLYASNSELIKWNYYKQINIVGDNKYKSIYLDEDVYKNSQANVSDIRVVDNKDEFVPFYMSSGNYSQNQNETVYDAKEISNIKVKKNTLTDFEIIPIKENTDIVINKLKIIIDEDKFLKNIEILGSYDGLTWQSIIQDSIYRIENYTKSDVSFNENLKYKYYRIKILDNIENIQIGELKPVYNGVQTQKSNFEKKATLKYEVELEGKDTIITLHNDNKLKTSQINLDINDIFNRRYKVYNDLNQEILSGELYNLQFKNLNAKNTSISLNNSIIKSDIIKIKIINNDNKPLDIKNIEVNYLVDKLVFEAKKDFTYKLYFGNIDAKMPNYDLNTYKNQIEQEPQDISSLGGLNEISKAKSNNYDYKKIFNIVISVIAVVLIGVIGFKLKGQNKN